jgi:hypothetical protein
MIRPGIVRLLAFCGSRKVGFGLWLFFVSTGLLVRGHIGANEWMLCAGLVSALVGGGTVADRWLDRRGVESGPGADRRD